MIVCGCEKLSEGDKSPLNTTLNSFPIMSCDHEQNSNNFNLSIYRMSTIIYHIYLVKNKWYWEIENYSITY